MVGTFFSLLGSLAQAQIVWNGDINVVMFDGSVDWLGLCGLAVIVCITWVASRKR
jgi:prepilin-type processing-associated H-X9-DG protein